MENLIRHLRLQEDIYYTSALPTIMIFVEEPGPVITLTLFEMDRADQSLGLAARTCLILQ